MEIQVHFIWIGRMIPPNYLGNVYKWFPLNPNYVFNLWYDQRLTIQSSREYLEYLNDERLHLRDVNMEGVLYQDVVNMDALRTGYEIETGIVPRKNYTSLINYGMATDILRLLILRKFRGFYFDVDIQPRDLLNVNICALRLCFAQIYYVLSNAGIYYDGLGDSAKVMEDVLEWYVVKLNELYTQRYFNYPFLFEQITLETTGPIALNEALSRQYKNYLFTNNLFLEEEVLGQEHTWFLPITTLVDIFESLYINRNMREPLRLFLLQQTRDMIEAQLNIKTLASRITLAIQAENLNRASRLKQQLNQRLVLLMQEDPDPRPVLSEEDAEDEEYVAQLTQLIRNYQQLSLDNTSFLYDYFIDIVVRTLGRDYPEKKAPLRQELQSRLHFKTINSSNKEEIVSILNDLAVELMEGYIK